MEGFDLRKFQTDEKEQEKIQSIMGKILSGRNDYKAIIEKRAEVKKCSGCNKILEGSEKFCPECGTRI